MPRHLPHMVPLHHAPNSPTGHRLIEVERSAGGLIVTFEDGRTAVFDADWMYGQISHASRIVEPGDEDSQKFPS